MTRARSIVCALASFIALLFCLLFSSRALARPGGGQSFRSPTRSSPSFSSPSRSSPSRPSYTPSYSPPRSSYTPSHPSYAPSHDSSPSSQSSNNWSYSPSYSLPRNTPVQPQSSSLSDGPPEPRGGSMTEFFFFVFIAAAIIVLAVWAWVRVQKSKQADWSSRLDEEAAMMAAIERESARRQANVAEALAFLRSKDDRFSRAVLEDFLHALFAAVHRARGDEHLDTLAPYVDEGALGALKGRRASGVRDIIVGGMHTESVLANPSSRRVLITVVFTANYTEGEGDGGTSYYVEERWKLSRGADAQSRKPDASAVIGCPNCGAPLEKLVDEKCRYCGQVTKSADFDWRVEAIEETAREARGPILTGLVEEVGTDDPTKVAHDARKLYAGLSRRDPAFNWSLFLGRVGLVFRTFHDAWSNRNLKPMRPYLSDALFETERYWVAT